MKDINSIDPKIAIARETGSFMKRGIWNVFRIDQCFYTKKFSDEIFLLKNVSESHWRCFFGY
jgi:hypothetical protein